MEIRISVPEALLSRPGANTKRIQTMLKRVLILELHRQGAAAREQAAAAADMTPEEFDALNESVRLPAIIYRNASVESFHAIGNINNGRRSLFLLAIFAGLFLTIAVAFFHFKGRVVADMHVRHGLTLLMKDEKTAAAISFKKALSSEPKNETANTALGSYHIDLADKALKKGHRERANQLFKTAIPFLANSMETNPRNPQILYDAGYAYEMLGEKAKAIEFYKRALEIDPDYTSAELRLDNIVHSRKPAQKPN